MTTPQLQTPRLKAGEIVTLYQDPVTCTKFDANAELVQFIGREDTLERWLVELLDESGGVVERWLNLECY